MFALCIESSHLRGMGHLYRSINLADQLIARGYEVHFLINDHQISQEILKNHGYELNTVDLLDFQSDWESEFIHRKKISLWINDRLNTDRRHALHVVNSGIPLVTFDDRGSGAKYSDLQIAALAFNDCDSLEGKQIISGIDYLILNPEIARYRRVRHLPEPLLVTLGGSDTWGVTVKVVAELTKKNLTATVVLGPGFKHETALKQVLTDRITVKQGVPSMAEEMSHFGLAITGGGITPFEANAAGLPCIVIANEEFEITVGKALQWIGSSIFVGHHSQFNESCLDLSLPIKEMSQRGINRISLSGAQNVVTRLEEIIAR